ncbi:hypothetical protein RIF29_22514 [Crotalaria pallida]|uniref:Uncharacterized protein n=1 Tax=Crotalaria pallida TaxID=3830 RepID=A0AAN9FDI8_CROPI
MVGRLYIVYMDFWDCILSCILFPSLSVANHWKRSRKLRIGAVREARFPTAKIDFPKFILLHHYVIMSKQGIVLLKHILSEISL